MRYAIFALALTMAFLFFGCIGQPTQQSTGASNIADYGYYSARINSTGIVGPFNLSSAYSRHVFTIWSTNSTVEVTSTTYSLNTLKTCSPSNVSGGQTGSVDVKYNDTTLATANGTRLVLSLTVPERNTTLNNMTVKYQNNSSSNVTVTLNGVYLGLLNTSKNSTTFSLNGSNLLYGTNTVLFTNTGNMTNITNITIQYLNSTFNCSYSNSSDNKSNVIFETADMLGQLNLTISNVTLNNTTTFDLHVYGGDLGVVVNTGYTYIGLVANSGFCDPLDFLYPLTWNATNWTNITGLASSNFVKGNNITICTKRKTVGNVLNYGAAIDYVFVNGSNTYNFTGGSVCNVTFSTSIDNVNWFSDYNATQIGPAQRIQTNQTALFSRFNVTNITLTDASQDACYIRYVAVSN